MFDPEHHRECRPPESQACCPVLESRPSLCRPRFRSALLAISGSAISTRLGRSCHDAGRKLGLREKQRSPVETLSVSRRFCLLGQGLPIDGQTYTSGVAANSIVAPYVNTPGICQTLSLHPVLERSYVAGVGDEGFRIIGSGVCGTIVVYVPSETSWANPLVGPKQNDTHNTAVIINLGDSCRGSLCRRRRFKR